MATYSITTTPHQERGLQFAYDAYADKTAYPTQESYFQFRIDLQVSDPLYQEEQRAQSQSFTDSFLTIPEANRPAARLGVERAITSNGGTLILAGTPAPPVRATAWGLPAPGVAAPPPMPLPKG